MMKTYTRGRGAAAVEMGQHWPHVLLRLQNSPHQILWNSKQLPSASCRAVCVCLEAGKRSKLLWPPIALSAGGTLCVSVSFVSHFVYFPRCSYLGNLKCTGRHDAHIFVFLEQTESSQGKHILTIVQQPDEGNTLCLQITSYKKCGAPCNCRWTLDSSPACSCSWQTTRKELVERDSELGSFLNFADMEMYWRDFLEFVVLGPFICQMK